MPQAEQTATLNSKLQCSSCGATLHFAPGTHHLQCTYCNTVNEIAQTDSSPIISFDYHNFITGLQADENSQPAKVVACKNCGAATTLPPEVNSDNCAFCASPLVLSDARSQQLVRPHYVLPFLVPNQEALKSFRNWLSRLWFAPSDLSKIVSGDARRFKGVYIPHWSYDTDASSDYTGSRGDYYYTTETYTENVNGEDVIRTREVRNTAWSRVSGTVICSFNDILVSASNSLPQKVANRLEPWDLEQLVHYNEQYVSGFRSELYQIDAEKGLAEAQQRMEPEIREAIRSDIGGDEQSINTVDTTYDNLALKYILLPAWISAYNYNNKLYHFTVNASTGEVVGERPYSAVKITLAIIAGIALIIIVIFLISNR